MRGTWIRSATAVALVAMLVAASGALAAVRLAGGKLYTGKDADCGSSVAGTTCVFKFRASSTGRSLRFVGKPVIDTWRCNGGGGEAILGGKLKNLTTTPIPLLKLRGNGTLYGSVAYTIRPTSVPPEHFRSVVTGHLTDAGKKVVVTFHNTYLSGAGNQPCATLPVTLTAH